MQQITAEGGPVGAPIQAVPVTADHCTPVPTGTDLTTTTVPFHLLAVVTQTLRGELAVVNLTAQHVVDTSLALPGINFLPVGQNPTDVVVTPDAQKVFVTSAYVNKPAIYMIPSTHLLGDSEVLAEPSQAAEQVTLPTWPACSLPQAPGRMVVVPTGSAAGDAGDAGAGSGYEIVVVMPGNGIDEDALVGVIDTAAFDSIAPGSLAPCPISQTIHLAENKAALPSSWTPGPTWPLGLPYVDGGVDLFATDAGGAGVQPSTDYHLPLWSCPALAHAGLADAGAPDASPIATTPGNVVHGKSIATDGKFVFVSDDQMPFIHVIDTRTPGTLSEIAPLLATSVADPSRVVTTSELAISPVTRDYKRYLYAVDATQGNSVMVYDVTDPENGPRTPLRRPNGELDPLQPADRIAFNAPVSTITFARHDFAVPGNTGATPTGVLCNPNPNAGPGQGIEYRANGTISVPLGPTRLRGVFAFATLSNGQVVAVDVDDWDAPCRRPLSLVAGAKPGSLAFPEPGSNDVDPYHAPAAAATGLSDAGGILSVSNETMWPIIQPNRIRSSSLVVDDLTGVNGLHDPAIPTAPQLLVNGAPVSLAASSYALLTAAFPNFSTTVAATPQPAPPNVYMAHDVPEAHVADQTWNITYEGALPGFDGVAGDLSTTDNFATLQLSSSSASFCGHGVEDRRVAAQRFAALQVDDQAYSPANTTMIPTKLDQRIGDYVQITDDIVGVPNPLDAGTLVPDPSDPYWSSDQDCWGPIGSNDPKVRQQVCIDKFGAYGQDQNAQRDFPILEASEDHLVLGRYLYTDATNRPTNGRIVAPRDTTTQADFQMAKCCFHNQAHFHVRTGAEWVAVGSVSGYLHHVVPDATKACVESCDPAQVLLNARVTETAVALPGGFPAVAPGRNSPFALRNPMFSFYLSAPVVTGNDAATLFSVSVRDDAWQFTTRGQYGAEGVSLVGTNGSVVPQSSMFIPSLGAVGVVDGSANGLFIIDLNTLSIADGSPFY